MVLIGELALQDEDLKVEKSLVPLKRFAPFLIILRFSFFLIFQALCFSRAEGDCLFNIRYL